MPSSGTTQSGFLVQAGGEAEASTATPSNASATDTLIIVVIYIPWQLACAGAVEPWRKVTKVRPEQKNWLQTITQCEGRGVYGAPRYVTQSRRAIPVSRSSGPSFPVRTRVHAG